MNRETAKFLIAAAGLGSTSFLLRGKFKPALWFAALATLPFFLIRSKYDLVTRSVVITGGSRGFGLAMAKAFLHEGSQVTLLARDDEELQRAKKHLVRHFGPEIESDVFTLVCDVTDENQLREAIVTARQKFGKIDVFVNNAGSMLVGPFETFGREDFEAQMKIHFYSVVQATQLLVPIFREQREGHIVNISSIGGKLAVPHMCGYCASKFALSGFSQAIQAELRKSNIHVTTVYPGLMRTGSAPQAVFKGDHEREYAWFSFLSLLPGLTVSPNEAAERVVAAVQNRESEVVISPFAKVSLFIHHNLPEIFADLNALVARMLPYGLSKKRKTGAASQRWLNQQPWGRAFQSSIQRAQEQNNERDSFNSRFNLNL